jgi:hypothetical protein
VSTGDQGPETLRRDVRPGLFAWSVIVMGWAVMGVATVGAFTDVRLNGIGAWVTWVLGAALVHDLVLLPVVLASGWLLSRWLPVPWRVPLRTALVVAGIVALSVWPIARRWGARADNRSILPLPVQRNLLVLVATLVVVGVGVGAVSAWRARGPEQTRSEDPS